MVEADNIYVAWERDHRTEVENYEHTKGDARVNAESTQWIDVAPPILIL